MLYIHLFFALAKFEEWRTDFRDLRYFEVIAVEGNLRRAAERPLRTQPVLTKCIDR